MKIRLLVDPPEDVYTDQMIGSIILAFERNGYQISRGHAYILWLMRGKPFFIDASEIGIHDHFDGLWAEKDEDEFL